MMMTVRFAAAAAVNDRTVLTKCLSASPDIASGRLGLATYEGFGSASLAYNSALADARCDILMLVHQDVYLPAGYLDRLVEQFDRLREIDPNWAVAGVIGQTSAGPVFGRIWSSGIGGIVGTSGALPARVDTLDEMIIFVRTAAGLRFDERLPGFHLYAADIVQIAASQGGTTWVIDAPAVHHSRPVVRLGRDYKRAWHYMRRKWKDRLPLPNLVCKITPSPWAVWQRDLRIRLNNRGRRSRNMIPTTDPAKIARDLGFDRDERELARDQAARGPL